LPVEAQVRGNNITTRENNLIEVGKTKKKREEGKKEREKFRSTGPWGGGTKTKRKKGKRDRQASNRTRKGNIKNVPP